MDRLLITADDFTGSLDTGIQFAKKGIPVKVVTDVNYDFRQLSSDIQVIVVDTESRPLSAKEAYERVYQVTRRAKEAGISYFYKKTDSALRGNIGSELLGMMDGCGEKVLFMAPAFPKINRLTKDGIHTINGVPVEDSVFGKDPFEPVRFSKIADIIHSQEEILVENVPETKRECAEVFGDEKKILVFDVTSEESLGELADFLKEKKTYRLCSGCAGFAAYYDRLLEFSSGEEKEFPKKEKLLCLIGSVNPITVEQAAYAKEHGFDRENLPCFKKLEKEYYFTEEGQRELDELYKKVEKSGRYMIDALDVPGEETVAEYAAAHGLTDADIRERISDTLGTIAWELVKRGYDGALSVTGGDTLMGFMRKSGCQELVPLAEIGQGAVLSKACWEDLEVPVISKSGGFGAKDIYIEMVKKICYG